jgi:hypothetical protein
MSYDLMLEGAGVSAFGGIVANAPHVAVNGELGWVYSNEATGVYFTLAEDELLEPPAENDPIGRYIVCSLNYLRPSFFVDEAVPVILDLASAAGLTVRDPQLEGIPRPPGAIDLAAIREIWQSTTRAWVERMDYSEQPPRMDPSAANALWRYNAGRPELESREELFVPTLFVRRKRTEPDRALRCVTWGPGLGLVFPPADVVAVVTERRLGPIAMGKTLRFVSYAAFVDALGELAQPEGDLLRLTIEDANRATSRVKKLDGLSDDSYEAIGYDGFVDVA